MRITIQFNKDIVIHVFDSPFVPRVGDYITFVGPGREESKIKVEEIDYDLTSSTGRQIVRLFTKRYESIK